MRVADKDSLLALQYERHGLGDRDAVRVEEDYGIVLVVLALGERLVDVQYRELAGIGEEGDPSTVPDAEGMDFEAAQEVIWAEGFAIDKHYAYDADVPEGKIISMEPKPISSKNFT